jgi:hypothetical protein
LMIMGIILWNTKKFILFRKTIIHTKLNKKN